MTSPNPMAPDARLSATKATTSAGRASRSWGTSTSSTSSLNSQISAASMIGVTAVRASPRSIHRRKPCVNGQNLWKSDPSRSSPVPGRDVPVPVTAPE